MDYEAPTFHFVSSSHNVGVLSSPGFSRFCRNSQCHHHSSDQLWIMKRLPSTLSVPVIMLVFSVLPAFLGFAGIHSVIIISSDQLWIMKRLPTTLFQSSPSVEIVNACSPGCSIAFHCRVQPEFLGCCFLDSDSLYSCSQLKSFDH